MFTPIPGFSENAVYLLCLLLILVAVLLGCLAFLFVKFIRLTRKNYLIEQQLLLSQMNPHFIFNSLTTIQSYIFRNDPHQAGKYLASFAKLIRLMLENSRLESTSIENEVKILKHYFELQNLRFEGKFDYHIHVHEKLDVDENLIPPMLAQPFIENAIEHGFLHIMGKGRVDVRFLLHDHSIVLEVEDNGIGIEKSMQIQKAQNRDYKSLATTITQERLRKIRSAKNLRIEFTISDISHYDATLQGTIVRFKIPLSHAQSRYYR